MRQQSAAIQHAVLSDTTHQVIMKTVYSILKLWLGTMYPAYNSYKAMQAMSMVEYVHCMTYWIVFSVLTLFEQLFDDCLVMSSHSTMSSRSSSFSGWSVQ